MSVTVKPDGVLRLSECGRWQTRLLQTLYHARLWLDHLSAQQLGDGRYTYGGVDLVVGRNMWDCLACTGELSGHLQGQLSPPPHLYHLRLILNDAQPQGEIDVYDPATHNRVIIKVIP